MTVPSNAPAAQDAMDPTDIVDFVIDLAALLDEGEMFDAIDFAVMVESVLLGFTILDRAPHAPTEVDATRVKIWVTVDPAFRNAAAWKGKGTICGVEFTATTDRGRQFQRTIAIGVVEK